MEVLLCRLALLPPPLSTASPSLSLQLCPVRLDTRLLSARHDGRSLPVAAGNLLSVLSPPCCLCVKEYITVSQLSQIFGMQRVDASSSSSTPSFQLASSGSFSCHSAPSSFLSAQVCFTFPLQLHVESFSYLLDASHVTDADAVSPPPPTAPLLWLDASHHHLRASLI